MPEIADGDLVRRAQRGDKGAFGELFARYEGRIFGYLYRMVGDRAWAEDLTQDAFVRAHQHLGRLGPPYDFKSWIYRIAGNLALDGLRRSRREVPLPDWDSGEPEPADTSPAADPYQQARQAEIRAAVWRTLHRLPDVYRQVLVLRELEGLSYQEIAAATGLSLDNVRVTLHRARLTFRDLYGLQVMVEEGRQICGELNELLSAEMDGELDRATRRRVQQHIAACPVCQRTRRELLTVSGLLATLAPVLPPPFLRARVLERLAQLPDPPSHPPGPPSRPRSLPLGPEFWAGMAGGVILFLLLLALLILAARALPIGALFPSPTPSPLLLPPLPTATPFPEEPTVPPTPVPSPVPSPQATPTTPCVPDAEWVADVTVPDNTVFAPGTAFVKTWRIRNSGTCNWEPGTQLVFVSGDPMGGPAAVGVPATAAGAQTDISVNLTAPATPGTYRSNWQLQAPDGTRFGPILYVQIVVPAPATNTPPPTATFTPAPTATPTQTPIPSACAIPVDPALQPALTRLQSLYPTYDLGCPTQASFTVGGAFQDFFANVENPDPQTHYLSLMVWRSDNREIYVIDGQDTNASQGALRVYTDTWDETQPPIYPKCANMKPPTGYQLPIRGFGKVWCVNGLWNPIGWPNEAEKGVNLLIQPVQSGLLLKVSGPIPMGYLIALDYRTMWAVTVMTAP